MLLGRSVKDAFEAAEELQGVERKQTEPRGSSFNWRGHSIVNFWTAKSGEITLSSLLIYNLGVHLGASLTEHNITSFQINLPCIRLLIWPIPQSSKNLFIPNRISPFWYHWFAAELP